MVKYLSKCKHNLQVIITSATFDVKAYEEYFATGRNKISRQRIKTMDVAGVQNYEIETILPSTLPVDNMLDTTLKIILEDILINRKYEENIDNKFRDILVFLDSSANIRRLKSMLEEKLNSTNYPIFKLTANTSDEDKNLITMDINRSSNNESVDNTKINELYKSKRRIVLANNAAQTGITLSNLRHVIDTGWQNAGVYSPSNGASGLIRSHVSHNDAMQRRGRVGRKSDGYFYPLYEFNVIYPDANNNVGMKKPVLLKDQIPSIYYTDLSQNMLEIIDIIKKFVQGPDELINIYSFNFMDNPPISIIHRNLSELYLIGAIDHNLELTKIGKLIKTLPKVNIGLAKSIIAAQIYNCTYEVAIIAACSILQESFYDFSKVPQGYTYPGLTDYEYKSDHINMLVTFMKYLNVKRSVNNESHLNSWCKINRLNASSLNSAYEGFKDIIKSMVQAQIPIVSYNRPIDEYTDKMKQSIIKALFIGLYLNRARIGEDPRYLKVYNWYGSDYYAESYKSSFYGNLNYKNMYPKHVFFSKTILKNKGGGYVNYLAGGISPYNPMWIGTLVPKVNDE
jgi:HrpA-like RNA helicase